MLPETNTAGLHYVYNGNGNITLVFLHYFGGSSRTWKPVIDLLKNDFHCIAVDLPGFGASAPLMQTATVKKVAAEVETLFKKLEVKNYILVGHSMGGKIAMQLASMPSATVQRLILTAPSPPTPEPITEEKRKELLSVYGNKKALEKLAESLVAEPLSNAELNNIIEDNLGIHQSAWNDWLNYGSKEDITSQLKNIRVPLMVISGAKDHNFSSNFLRKEFTKCFPVAHFEEISNTGHLLPIEAPYEIAMLIKKFISA